MYILYMFEDVHGFAFVILQLPFYREPRPMAYKNPTASTCPQ